MNTPVDGFVRPAWQSDAESIARVHIESTRSAYAPLAKVWPEPDWEGKRTYWEARLAPSLVDPKRVDLVAEAQGTVVGFISGGETRQAGIQAEVEIYVIHVLPEYRGTGIGGRLWSDACGRIRGESLCAESESTSVEHLASRRMNEAAGPVSLLLRMLVCFGLRGAPSASVDGTPAMLQFESV